jgi:uncharacterized protein YukE
MSSYAESIRSSLADSPDIDTNDISKKMLEDHGEFAKFRGLMRKKSTEIYTQWRNHSTRAGATNWVEPWNDQDEKKLEDLKHFAFYGMGEMATRVEALQKVATQMSEGAHDATKRLGPVWEGDSGDAARDSLKRFVKASAEAANSWGRLAQVVKQVRDEVKNTIRDLVERGAGGPVGEYVSIYRNINHEDEQKHNGNVKGAMEAANGKAWPGASPEEIAAEVMGYQPTDFELSFGGGSWMGNIYREWAGWYQWLDDHNNWYSSALHEYRQHIDNATNAIEQLLNIFGDTYNSGSERADLNPLAAVRPEEPKPKERDKGSDRTGPSDTGPGPSGPGPSGPGPSGPGPSGPGPSGPGPSGPGPSSPGPSNTPTTPSDTSTDQPDDGTNPVTGKPLEVDPKTGKPYPIDPETGEPIKDVDDQDTTTVRQGDNEITVTEPSATGEMKVSVDDGKGGTKTYHLDFDPDKNPEDVAEEGSESERESVGGTTGGSFGPQGSGKDMPGGKGPDGEVHTPGEDGKIRIKDGDVEIVAEQPNGPDGVTVVTVDDGKGEPITQILGDDEAVEEYKQQLEKDREELLNQRETLQGRENVSQSEWEELKKEEQNFRERGGHLPDDDGKHAEKVSSPAQSGEERTPPRSVFDAADQERSAGLGKSAFGADGGSGAGVGQGVGGGGGAGVAEGVGGGGSGGASATIGGGGPSSMGGNLGGDSIGDSAQNLEAGGRSGVMAGGGAPAGVEGATAGGPGVGTAPGGGGDQAATRGGGMMGGGMMGGAGAAGGGGGDESRSSNAAYRVSATDLFEPEVGEGPFGVARISGSLDDEEG